MILTADITEKSFGNTDLFKDVHIEVHNKEKIGLIGRNGTGKSTLLKILTGEDTDFQGEVTVKKGSVLVAGRQEHHGLDAVSVLEYVQGDLPEYSSLIRIIDTYPETMGDDARKIQVFSDALERFTQLGYYQLEDELAQAFAAYQLPADLLHRSLGSLSGGQKRLVELIKIQRSRGHLALIDEPTNHMDYIAKAAFIKWLTATEEAVLVITHDRDVLDTVDRIVEIRDGFSVNFRGNYAAYLRTNTSQVGSQVNEYDQTQRRIENLRQDVLRFRRLKEKSRDPGTIRRFKSQEQKAVSELAQLEQLEKPSFWIDQASVTTMNVKLAKTYDRYKATNIKVRTKTRDADNHGRVLVRIDNLSLGYGDTPLFASVQASLHEGERLRLHGRNGAGKTTLVQAIMATAMQQSAPSRCFAGSIELAAEIPIGLYEQEINPAYLQLTLDEALEQILRASGQVVSMQKIKQLQSDYLFDPATDGELRVAVLSGGQKARLQLIAMLAGDPKLLILDEPTNHLDLPSIEELENALLRYEGAIMYISHDSYFAAQLGGQTVQLGN